MTGNCKLCGTNAPLILSHVIPKFVIKWLKRTSATGYFRSLRTGKRLQEAPRIPLLCSDCEQRLGRHEKQFCERVFLPYQRLPQPKSFEYDEWLLRFLVGLHWRVLATDDSLPKEVRGFFVPAQERWRQYLLELSPDPGTSEFHLQFVDVIEHSTFKIPKKMNWYLARSTDASPIHNENGEAGVFVKFPRLIMLAFITARDPSREDWKGTQVGTSGVISVRQDVSTTAIGQFVLERGKLMDGAPPMMTQRQKQKMHDQAFANPETILTSDSYRVHMADRSMRLGPAVPRNIGLKGRDRNKSCPCGSGLKGKKCCGRPA
jgi:hypothetical protein